MPLPGLTPAQQRLVDHWLPGAELIADMSWPTRLTIVLHVRTATHDAVVKAGGEVTGHHISREIDAGTALRGLGPGLPTLIAGSAAERMVALHHQPGALVEGADAGRDPAVYREAARLLRRVHSAAPPRPGTRYAWDRVDRLRRLVEPARPLLDGAIWRATVADIEAIVPAVEPVVPTHGDVQPRNWVVDHNATGTDGTPAVALIDFGRFDHRPWYTDVVRLFHACGADDLRLLAFLDGLGQEPPWLRSPASAEGAAWRAENLYQALSTVVWATKVGDGAFADDGRAMLTRTLRGG
ncbi:aminoglycoside phosphotransferase family protein [Cellulomonas hominis]